MKAPILLTASKVGSKTKITFWNQVRKRDHSSISALVDIVDSVEQEREWEMLIELGDVDDCTEKKEDADFSMD